MARNLLEREAVNERLPGITNNVGIRHVYYCVVGLYQQSQEIKKTVPIILLKLTPRIGR
nr:hypothetical protein [Lactobacillus sp. ESL0259]